MHCEEGWTVCLVKQVDVLDDSEGLPVSLVKHGLVDGPTCFILLAHLVRCSVNFGGLIENDVCFVSGNMAGAKNRGRKLELGSNQ